MVERKYCVKEASACAVSIRPRCLPHAETDVCGRAAFYKKSQLTKMGRYQNVSHMHARAISPSTEHSTYLSTYPRFVIAYPALHGGARGSPHNGALPHQVPIGSGDEQVIGKPCLRFRRFGHCVTRTWLAWVSEYIEVGVCLQQSIGHTLQYLDLDLGFSGLILRPFCDLCASSFQRLPTQHTRSAPRHSACQWLVTAAPSTTLPTNTLTEFPLF